MSEHEHERVTPGEFALDSPNADRPEVEAVQVGFGEQGGPIENVKILGLGTAAHAPADRRPEPAGEFAGAEFVDIYDETGRVVQRERVGGEPVYDQTGEIQGWREGGEPPTPQRVVKTVEGHPPVVPVKDANGRIIEYRVVTEHVQNGTEHQEPHVEEAPAQVEQLFTAPEDVYATRAAEQQLGEPDYVPTPGPTSDYAFTPPEPDEQRRPAWEELDVDGKLELLLESFVQLAGESDPQLVATNIAYLTNTVGKIVEKLQQLEASGITPILVKQVRQEVDRLDSRVSTLASEMTRAVGVQLNV